MAQALAKVNVSKTEQNEFFAQKMVIFSKFLFLAKSSFLKKILAHSTNQLHTFAQQVLTQQIPIVSQRAARSAELPPNGGTGKRN